MTRKALRQKARRRAERASRGDVLRFYDVYSRELLTLGVGGDERRTPKPQWWRPGESPNRWEKR